MGAALPLIELICQGYLYCVMMWLRGILLYIFIYISWISVSDIGGFHPLSVFYYSLPNCQWFWNSYRWLACFKRPEIFFLVLTYIPGTHFLICYTKPIFFAWKIQPYPALEICLTSSWSHFSRSGKSFPLSFPLSHLKAKAVEPTFVLIDF